MKPPFHGKQMFTEGICSGTDDANLKVLKYAE